MATLYNDNVFRGDAKIGYYEGSRFFDWENREIGYYEGTRVYDRNGREKGYIENDQVYWADGAFFDEVEKVRQHVSGGDYAAMPCVAVSLLFGWD